MGREVGKHHKESLWLEQRSIVGNIYRGLENCRIWCRHRIIRIQGILENKDGSNLGQML